MASLNLIPNPSVLVVQAGVFLANILVVKKLFVEPYLMVRDRREQLTIGGKDEASQAFAEADRTAADIQTRLSAAMAAAKKERDSLREVATQKRQALLAEAEAQAKKHVDSVEQQIKSEMTAERAKIPGIVASLTDEVYLAALS